MNLNFYKNLMTALLKNDYQIIKNCYDTTEISADSKYIGFVKKNGSMLNFVYLLKLDSLKTNFPPFIDSLENLSKAIAKEYNSKNTSSLFIYIGRDEDISDDVLALCENTAFDISANNLSVHWLVNLTSLKLVVSKNQPDKLDGIEKLVAESFNGLAGGFSDVNNAIKNDSINKFNNLKSKNIYFTYFLMGINIFVYLLMLINGDSESISTLIKFGALEPSLIINEHQYYRLFTAMFVHIGYMHLFSNIFSLYIIGSRIERYMGKLPYILIYIISGLTSSLFSTYLTGSVAAGASGAIWGLYGAILIFTAFNRKSMQGIDFYTILIMIILGFSISLMTPYVDNFAHLGGLIGGLIITIIYIFIQKGRLKKANERIN